MGPKALMTNTDIVQKMWISVRSEDTLSLLVGPEGTRFLQWCSGGASRRKPTLGEWHRRGRGEGETASENATVQVTILVPLWLVFRHWDWPIGSWLLSWMCVYNYFCVDCFPCNLGVYTAKNIWLFFNHSRVTSVAAELHAKCRLYNKGEAYGGSADWVCRAWERDTLSTIHWTSARTTVVD